MKTVPFACLALSMVFTPVLASAKTNMKEFARTMATPDGHLRHKLIEKLDGNDSKQLGLLFKILEGKAGPYCDWYDREAAIKALAKTANSAGIKKMVKKLKHKNWLVRQGICAALAKMNDEEKWPQLLEMLNDKDARVRREVAHALRINRKKESIEALIQRWLVERDPIVTTFIRNTLEDITRRYKGPDPYKWEIWWGRVKHDFVVGSTDEEAEKQAEAEGKKMQSGETRTRDVTMSFTKRGIGTLPLLIIPPYGYSKDIITPFLTTLELGTTIYYIDLPKVDSFSNIPSIAGRKFYPVDHMVGAFEQLRKDTGVKRFAIMAMGMNSWIGVRYAQKYPKSVSQLILVSPISGNTEYGRASTRFINEGKRSNDLEMWHFGLTRSFNTQTGKGTHDSYHEDEEIAKPEGEGGGIDRKSWAMMFANPDDSLVALLYPVKDRRMGGVAIPDFESKREDRFRAPLMIITGKHSRYNSVQDAQYMAKHFNGMCKVYRFSSNMPHAEESAQFNKDVGKFLKIGRSLKAGFKKKKKKKKKKKGKK